MKTVEEKFEILKSNFANGMGYVGAWRVTKIEDDGYITMVKPLRVRVEHYTEALA